MQSKLVQNGLPKRKRSQRSIQTEQKILHSAKAVFSKAGVEKATTKDIALVSELSEGTIFHHFPNKLAILEKMMVEFYARLQVEAENICNTESDPLACLRALADNHLTMTLGEWSIIRLVIKYGRYGEPAFTQVFYRLNKEYTALFVTQIESLKQAGKLRTAIPTAIIRDTLFGSMEHFMIANYGRENDLKMRAFSEQLLDLLLFGAGGFGHR